VARMRVEIVQIEHGAKGPARWKLETSARSERRPSIGKVCG